MDAAGLIDISRESIYVLIKVSLPILLISLVVGFVISLLQALTQIQEATLSFVPKFIAIFLSLLLLGSFMVSNLKTLYEHISERIIHINEE